MAQGSGMSIEKLLSRLQKVRRSGNDQWMACCPAHDDRSPSLSIKDAGNGRILVNCLAGCGALDVLGAIGMDFSDVMPEKQPTETFKPVRQRIYPSDALRAIKFEVMVVAAAAFAMNKGEKLTPADIERLKTAMERMNEALEMI
jgi:hypothetical protein